MISKSDPLLSSLANCIVSLSNLCTQAISRCFSSTAFSNASLDKVLTLFSSGSRSTISWWTASSPLFAGPIYLISTVRLTSICSLTSLFFDDQTFHCRVPSTADTGCSVIGSARSTTVKYGTDSRLLNMFIGLNHVIRLADLLQHCTLSKLRKPAKLQIWRRKTQLTIVTYVWPWLRGWENSKL